MKNTLFTPVRDVKQRNIESNLLLSVHGGTLYRYLQKKIVKNTIYRILLTIFWMDV